MIYRDLYKHICSPYPSASQESILWILDLNTPRKFVLYTAPVGYSVYFTKKIPFNNFNELPLRHIQKWRWASLWPLTNLFLFDSHLGWYRQLFTAFTIHRRQTGLLGLFEGPNGVQACMTSAHEGVIWSESRPTVQFPLTSEGWVGIGTQLLLLLLLGRLAFIAQGLSTRTLVVKCV